MTTADRIKLLRESLGLTQEQLASRMGYTGKSSISKIESSGDNVTLKKISKLAPILHTSEAYLMGWTDNPDPSYQYSVDFGIELVNNVNTNMQNMLSNAYNTTIEARKTSSSDDEFFNSLPSEEKKHLIHFYQLYQNADPVLQKVVERILKESQQESEHHET